MLLFFDTETTGFHEPHLVQLGALLTDDNGKEMGVLDVIIKPYGKSVEPGALAVHGIDDLMRSNFGVSVDLAMRLFNDLCSKAQHHVAHNAAFDQRVLVGVATEVEQPLLFTPQTLRCTMKESTPIVAIPNTNRAGFKWPKLHEAYSFFFNGATFSGAHNAMVDCRACRDVFFALRQYASNKANQPSQEPQ